MDYGIIGVCMDDTITKKLALVGAENRIALISKNALLAESKFEVSRVLAESARSFDLVGANVRDAFATSSVRAIALDTSGIRNAIAESVKSFDLTAAQVHNTFLPFADLNSQFVQIAKIAAEPFTQIAELGARIGAAFRETMEPFEKMREAIAAIPPTQLEVWQRSFAKLREELDVTWKNEKVEGPAFRLFAKLGFTGLESYLSLPELEYILKIHKKKRKRGVQEYVFRMFRSNRFRLLNRMIRGWWTVPYMGKRKRTVRAAIDAHKKKNYDLAITALLPLIDGLSTEIIPNLGKTIVTKEVAALLKQQESELWSECVEQVICSLVYRNYDFKKVKRPPSSVNRHGILHGRVVKYGTELNSYRVILLLNVMVKMAGKNAKKAKP